LQKRLPLILAACQAAQDPAQRERLDVVLERYSDPGWNKLVHAVQRILGGERDSEALGLDSDLNPDDSLIVGIILAALSDPSTLADLLPPEGPAA
jgi:hypothetical protein